MYASIRCTLYTQCRSTHPIPVQCWASAAVHCGTMPVNRIRRWPNIETELGDCPLFALTAIRVTFYAPKGHYPDSMIHWPNCEIMLSHRLRRWANIIPTETLQALNHEYNRDYFFSEDFLNTKVLNLGTSDVILHMFIRTGVQKCQPFPTDSTPLSLNRTQNKLNIIQHVGRS